jgi:Tol biopolymer transport system component
MDPAVSPDGKLLAYASDRAAGQNLDIWVQQLTPGGSAMQLTHEHADTRQPVFSPDGTQIFFHCAKEGRGVSKIPAIGGSVLRLAAQGFSPDVSPDGKWIAFQVGFAKTSIITGTSLGPSFVMPAAGGSARPIGSDIESPADPVWGPDSQHLLVSTDEPAASGGPDWFLVSAAGGPSRRTGLFSELKREGFSIDPNRVPHLSQWRRGYIVFSGTFGDATNIWRMPVADDGSAAGRAVRLTSGAGTEMGAVLSGSGELYFAALNTPLAIWGLPLDANNGLVRGDLKRMTSGPFDVQPSISADGNLLAFATARGKRAALENEEVRVKNMATGAEELISSPSQAEAFPHISSDGSMVAATATVPEFGKASGVRLVERERSVALKTVTGAFAWDWSHDDRRLLYYKDDGVIRCLDIPSGKEVFRLAEPHHSLFQARFSPDDRFVALEVVDDLRQETNSSVFIASLTGSAEPPAKEWIPIRDTGSWADKPRWSPDGTLLYFISNRDGQTCLWAQRLERRSKRPVGLPFAVRHFHNSALAFDNVGMGLLEIDIARDKAVLGLGEVAGNLWSVKVR